MKSELNKIKTTGYKAPEGYFDALENDVFSKMSIKNTLKDAGQSGFNAPEYYFDSVEDAVLDKLNTQSKTKVVMLFSRKHLMYAASIAAVFVLAFALFNNNESVPKELNYEQIGDYILEEGIDSYDLAALLTEEELTTMDTEIYSDTYNSDSVEDYLLENVDLEAIIDQ